MKTNLPLDRLLGGTNPEVPACGSTLDFDLSDDEIVSRLGDFKKTGFHVIKIKVGHPDVEWDLKRMQMATEVLGQDVELMRCHRGWRHLYPKPLV